MILVLSSVLFALMLASGQSLWKVAVTKHPLNEPSISSYLQVILSPYFIAGLLLYGLSVVIYLYALAHFEFSRVQALAIPLSLVFSILAAWLIFHEQLSFKNILGIGIIFLGIYLVISR